LGEGVREVSIVAATADVLVNILRYATILLPTPLGLVGFLLAISMLIRKKHHTQRQHRRLRVEVVVFCGISLILLGIQTLAGWW
jgi:hypothetical protein